MTYPMRHVAVALAQRRREEAIERLRRAEARRDTQAAALLRHEARRATLEAMRAEVAAGVAHG